MYITWEKYIETREITTCNLEDIMVTINTHPDLITIILRSINILEESRLTVDPTGYHQESILRALLDKKYDRVECHDNEVMEFMLDRDTTVVGVLTLEISQNTYIPD